MSAGYFDVFNIPILRGRNFKDSDTGGSGLVVIISQAMARKFWAQGDPLADQIVIGKGVGPEFEEGPRQIVGVAGDVRDGGLNSDPDPMMYVPEAQVPDGVTALNNRIGPITWIIRTRSRPGSLTTAMQNEIRTASGGLPVAHVRTMDEVVVKSTARADFNMLLLTIFGASALLLAAIGIYGLMAYSVEQRTQEIGIRLALGAETGAVRNMVVRQGMQLALIGVVVGVAAVFGLTRLLSTFLYGVKALDPLVFVSVPILLSLVALFAVWLPAQRATKIDPLEALRYE